MWLAALDLSLTSTGGVALPAGWGGDWTLIERMNVGYGLEAPTLYDEARRSHDVAADVVEWLFWLCHGDPTRIRVFVEDLPRFGRAFSVLELAMLRAEIQHELTTFHVVLEPVQLSTARKTLLGKVPQGKGIAKKTAIATVRSLTGDADPFVSDDEVEAFVVLNDAMIKLGERAFIAPPAEPKRRSR